MSKKAKTRTCLMCRNNFDKSELLRFVVDPANNLLLDVYNKAPARGSYVCTEQQCLDKALGKNVLAKMLKTNSQQKVKNGVAEGLLNRIEMAIVMLKKSQIMISGAENVIDLIKSNKAYLVLFAEDISMGSKEKINFYLNKSSTKSDTLLSKDELSDITNIANCSVLAFKKTSLTEQLEQAIKNYKKVLNT